jgi:hypothetical protein
MEKINTLHLIAPYLEDDMPQVSNIEAEGMVYINKVFYPIHLLPFLYAKQEEAVASVFLENEAIFEHLKLYFKRNLGISLESIQIFPLDSLDKTSYKSLSFWGAHPSLLPLFASNLQKIPPWKTICFANSKLSIIDSQAPYLKTYTFDSLHTLRKTLDNLRKKGPWIIKSPFQSAGNKNIFLPSNELSSKNKIKIETLLKKNPLIILQEKLKIISEFSSQWIIEKGQFTFVGYASNITTPKGAYSGCQVGAGVENFIRKDFIENHLKNCKNFLDILISKGYFGPVGFDALIYLNEENKEELIPILEVNARETFASLCIKIQNKYLPSKQLKVCFVKNEPDAFQAFPSSFMNIYKENIQLNRNLSFEVS